MSFSEIKLVITAALKAELPMEFLKQEDIRVVTLSGLKSGVLNKKNRPNRNRGILFIITGPGAENSCEAAMWISENLSPLYVVNVGSAGMLPRCPVRFQPDIPFIAASVCHESNQKVKVKTRASLPFPLPDNWTKSFKGSLVTSIKSIENKDQASKLGNNYAVDMEAWHQADLFQNTNINFHSVKFFSDQASGLTSQDYYKNIHVIRTMFKGLFSFLSESQKAPSVSVVIPVFNRPEQVRMAIESVLGQQYHPIEIIVVDDGSTDNTPKTINLFSDKLKIITFPENRGVSFARNAGIRAAQGEWIALLDSDDQWTENKLLSDVKYLTQNPYLDILQSEEMWIRKGKRVNRCKHHIKPEGWIFDKCVERCMISPSAVLFKKKLTEDFGMFDEDLPVCEDYDLWLRITRHRVTGLNPEVTLVKYGGADDQLSMKFPAMDRFRVQSLAKIVENERCEIHKKRVLDSLIFRLNILKNGALKRQKTEEVLLYSEMLENVKKMFTKDLHS